MPEIALSKTVHVAPWVDPLVDEHGHDPRSPYVERYWLGVLGPTATWLVRRLADRLDAEPDGFELDLVATAAELGVGHRPGQNGPFVRTLERCSRFGIVEIGVAGLRVRRRLPPLTAFQRERLPDHLRAELGEVGPAGRAPAAPAPHAFTVDELRERGRGFALSLLERGLEATAIERELHRRAVHPALAHEVVAWAVAHLAARQEGEPLPPAA